MLKSRMKMKFSFRSLELLNFGDVIIRTSLFNDVTHRGACVSLTDLMRNCVPEIRTPL